jgi:hypothetical protein
MKVICPFWFIGLIMLAHQANAQTSSIDSTYREFPGRDNFLRIDFLASSSFFINTNWKEINNSCIFATGSLNIIIRKRKNQWTRLEELRSELGYLKFIDSVWTKTTDNILVSGIWKKNGDAISHSFLINLKTQITDTWENLVSYQGAKRKWKSGPMLPANLVLGYGFNLLFRSSSYINFTLATIRVNSRPIPAVITPETKFILKSGKALFNSEYGFSLQSSIILCLSKNLYWENKSFFFGTGLEKRELFFDMQNSLSLKPVKFMKLRLDHRVVYDFIISHKLQYRTELLIGFSLEKNQNRTGFEK